ncbi:hypothetical protein L3Q82_004268 [Scortum barcoo]|uniref:Uncharacterized protein n=1 Tax=Scortum barcoo TaxID=214431 RepID=A0ACB8VJ87_9TELE|nr:hypothetical protein L3Q82_004268 [Scortum barcoo]
MDSGLPVTHRPQFVRVQGSESDQISFSAAPVLHREQVLAPFLFTLYTADFSYNTPSCHLQRRSLMTMTLLLLASSQMGTTESTEDLFRTLRTGACGTTSRSTLVKPRSWWWISAGVDHSPPAPVSIQGTDIDTVKSYKYLGVHLNDSLDWSDNTNVPCQEGQQQTVPAQEAEVFWSAGTLLRTFYDSVVASAIFYGIVCWASSITDRDRRRMDRLVRRASSVLGCPLDSVEVVGNGRMMGRRSSREEISWSYYSPSGAAECFPHAGWAHRPHCPLPLLSSCGSAAELSTIQANLTERLQESNTKLVSSIEERDQLKANLTEMTEELKRLQSLSKQKT